MIQTLTEITAVADEWIYSNVLVWLLLGVGIFLTLRMRFVQVRLFPEGIRLLSEKSEDGGVSSFQALMIATASRVGTGNIAGVATAIVIGGPGAVFWMWITAMIGSASAFVESTLAQIYKKKDGSTFKGGPAYYLEQAFDKRWLGMIFAIILVITFAFGFNGLQAYNIVSSLEYYSPSNYHVIALISGIALSLIVGFFFFGGVEKISKISSILVPIMAAVYILIGISITVANISYVPSILISVFKEAFHFKAIAGGFASSCLVVGIKKGLFSNEAGMGSAPNAAASADVSHPVKQGLVQVISVFIDTFIICTTTAGIVLCTQHLPSVQGLDAIPLVQEAVRTLFGEAGVFVFTLSVILFAFTSIIGNYFYAEFNIKFLSEDPRVLKAFRLFAMICVGIGANSNLELAWQIADITMAIMAFVNIVAIFLLNGIVEKALTNYEEQLNRGIDPVFYAEDIGIYNTEMWRRNDRQVINDEKEDIPYHQGIMLGCNDII